MEGRFAILLCTALLSGGCAASTGLLAKQAGFMCQHCNCVMPAGIDEQVICPVCDCGYQAHQCRRGTR